MPDQLALRQSAQRDFGEARAPRVSDLLSWCLSRWHPHASAAMRHREHYLGMPTRARFAEGPYGQLVVAEDLSEIRELRSGTIAPASSNAAQGHP